MASLLIDFLIMVAPEGTQHNSSIPSRLLGGIPFSQASPRRTVTAWMRVGLYTAGVFVPSSVSQPPLIPGREFPHLDKLYHSLGYGGPACLLAGALRLACPIGPSTALCVWGTVVTLSYGAPYGLHQAFRPGRMVSLPDVFAGAAGASKVASVWPHAEHRWPTLLCSKDQV
jgi:hypothetical protein